MTLSQAQRAAGLGQVLITGMVLIFQVVNLIRNRVQKTDVGPASS